MNKFFIVGPPRTGSTIMARCIDDHPKCICLFEAYIQKKAFGCSITRGHSGRMKAHGFTREQTDNLRGKVHDSVSFLNWYDDCAEILKPLYDKVEATHIGDVIAVCPQAKKAIQSFPKILTIRDPRAVWYSGQFHYLGKRNYLPKYYSCLKENLPYLETTLVVKFEDFIREPEKTMNQVYTFLGLPYDDSFMNRTNKPYDKRFDFNPNAVQKFDVSMINKWEKSSVKIDIPDRIKKLAEKFGYSL